MTGTVLNPEPVASTLSDIDCHHPTYVQVVIIPRKPDVRIIYSLANKQIRLKGDPLRKSTSSIRSAKVVMESGSPVEHPKDVFFEIVVGNR